MTTSPSQTRLLFGQVSFCLLFLFLLHSSLLPSPVLSSKTGRKESESSVLSSDNSGHHCKKLSFFRWLFHLKTLEQKLKLAEKRLNMHQENIKSRKEGKGHRKKQKEAEMRALLLKQYITLLRSAIHAEEATAQATADFLQQTSMMAGDDDENQSSLDTSLDSKSISGSSSSDQAESLQLLRRVQQAKQDEAAARNEVEALERMFKPQFWQWIYSSSRKVLLTWTYLALPLGVISTFSDLNKYYSLFFAKKAINNKSGLVVVIVSTLAPPSEPPLLLFGSLPASVLVLLLVTVVLLIVSGGFFLAALARSSRKGSGGKRRGKKRKRTVSSNEEEEEEGGGNQKSRKKLKKDDEEEVVVKVENNVKNALGQ